jgi:Ras-related protein Rab-21
VGLTIWDTAGQERYHALNANYYRGSKGAVIVYDVTDKDSFEKVKTWRVELRKYLEPGTPIIIAGNKCDIVNRTVPESEADEYARSVGCEHINTSAKSGHNVKECFT